MKIFKLVQRVVCANRRTAVYFQVNTKPKFEAALYEEVLQNL